MSLYKECPPHHHKQHIDDLTKERRSDAEAIAQLTKENADLQDKLDRANSSRLDIAGELQQVQHERDDLLSTKRHMDHCRALLKVPEDEVLGVAIEEMQEKAGRLMGVLKIISEESSAPWIVSMAVKALEETAQ